jgi:hypothetical protein
VTGPRFRLGVDFGTTHTVAALSFPDGRVQPLLFESNPLLPSAVFADDSGRLLVGRDAERSSRVDPARFEPNPKRRIDEGVVLLGGREFRTVDLVAAVLRRVYEEAVRVAGGPPAASVLTHPADWAATRMQVLTEAARQAGLGGVTLVPEPLAAAAYFSSVLQHQVAPGTALVVYDFGGGTFDISVIRRRPDAGWDVIATEGLDDVGGVDLDAAVIDRVGASVAPGDPVRWQRLIQASTPEEQRRRRLLWDEVRAAKEQLSRTAVAVVHVPLFDADVHVTREEFEQLARPWLERTVALTAATLFRTGLNRDQLSGVVLVGGSSRIPMVATLLHQRLGMPPTVLDQPELVVAQGSLAAVPAPGVGPQPAATAPFPITTPPDSPPAYGQTAEHAQPPGYGQPQPGYAQQPGYGQPGAHQRPMSPAAAGFGPPPAGPAWPPQGKPATPARRRRGPARIVAILAAVVLAVVVGGVALANLGDEDDPGVNAGQNDKIDVRVPSGDLSDAPATGAAEPTPSPTPPAESADPVATSAPPAGGGTGPRIVYEVLVAKPTKATTLTYHDKDGDTISFKEHPLPWKLEFTATDADFNPNVTAQIAGGTGRYITCKLTIDGKLREEHTDSSKLYPTVVC